MSGTRDVRKRTLDPEDLADLRSYLAFALKSERVDVPRAELLSGGAVQENWRLQLDVATGDHRGLHDVVLRTDAQARVPISLDRTGEYRVLKAAHGAGVTVAQPLLECPDASIIGAPFTLQAFVSGEANARALTRAADLDVWGDAAAFALGAELAKIHAIKPDSDLASGLSFLPRSLHAPGVTEVERLREALVGAGEARPALAYVLKWLETHPPRASATVLVHGDYRTGNMMLDRGSVRAVLDWEFAHWGDPCEDIGWFTARCWRFGNDS
ncbi:MAG: phosphotransferase family protein, partial [Pseudomonadota bacterium]